MKARTLIILSLLAATACSPPVTFRVEVDEPIAAGTLTLNGHSARLMKNVDGAYRAKWNGGEADGQIEIRYRDGGQAFCQIGYVTSGMGLQTVTVNKRVCTWTPTIS